MDRGKKVYCDRCGHLTHIAYPIEDREYYCGVCGAPIDIPYNNWKEGTEG